MKLLNTSVRYLVVIALVTMFAALAHAQNNQEWEEHNPTLVGRISHLEGDLSRYDTDQDEWVVISRDAPVGTDDRLQSAPDAKAEVILPNNIWIRMDGDTDVQLVSLTNHPTEMDLSFGTVRLYNKSATAEIKTTTPFGHVITPAGAIADLYVYDDGVEIIALKKSVYFVHNASHRQHEVHAGSGSIYATIGYVSADRGDGSTAWQTWNKEMDGLWAMRTQTKGESTTYLPQALHHDAYALDTHGRWERVHYQGAYYRFWRPVHVHAGWAPFSSGVWRVRWGDHVWIPHEPFGYVTHHYGNWIFTANHWYWAPPVTRVMVQAQLPLFHIGFSWYPGRVAWLHTSAHVGWFPLAPYEPYYTHRRWGRRSIVVAKGGHHRRHRHKYRHRHHATVIHRDHLYRGKNYRAARIKTLSRSTIDRKFRTVPVLNKTAVKNHRTRLHKRSHTARTDLRRLQPSSSRKHVKNQLKRRTITSEQRLKSKSKNTRRRSDTLNKRNERTKPLRKQESVSTRKQRQSREDRNVQTKLQRRDRIKAGTTDKRRQPESIQKRQRRNAASKNVNRKLTRPKANKNKEVREQRRTTRAVNRAPNKEVPQKNIRKTTTSRQRAKLKQRHSPRSRSNPSPRIERNSKPPAQTKGKVQSRPSRNQNQGRSYRTRGYAPQKSQDNRTTTHRSGGRRGSRSGR